MKYHFVWLGTEFVLSRGNLSLASRVIAGLSRAGTPAPKRASELGLNGRGKVNFFGPYALNYGIVIMIIVLVMRIVVMMKRILFIDMIHRTKNQMSKLQTKMIIKIWM